MGIAITSAFFERAIFPHGDETQIVDEFLGPDCGFFVDVGANDPKNGSQTWHLEQRGWTGVLVEPQPRLAEQLRQRRIAKVFAVACSTPANSGRMMPLNLAGPHSSLDGKWTSESEGIIAVPTRSLDQILVEAHAPSPIDFISIDVEGHGREVLDGLDLARWRPRLVLIEDHVMNLSIHARLSSNGYRWIRRTGLNSWYVPAENRAPVGTLGRLQFVRKYYLGIPFRHARDAVRRLRGSY